MFFHIDEAGNTGNNLFDDAQPVLSYGVLSSMLNTDVLSIAEHRKIQKIINSDQIHANYLGFRGLIEIAPLLIRIHKKMKFNFDYYFVNKKDYALVKFFDAVFDAGLNKAVKWDLYWTPLRYLIIERLSLILDKNLLSRSWHLCTTKRIQEFNADIAKLLTEVRDKVTFSGLDERSKEVIIDALNFGIKYPQELDFGCQDEKIISPNAVGFQFVVSCISRQRIKKHRKSVCSVIVDRQQQFNSSQLETHSNSTRIAEGILQSSEKDKQYIINHPLHATLSEDQIISKGLKDVDLTFRVSRDSIGLQIVDVYLWLANKVISGQKIPEELEPLWLLISKRSLINGISVEGMLNRFKNFEKSLPKNEDITDEQKLAAQKYREEHRVRVRNLNL